VSCVLFEIERDRQSLCFAITLNHVDFTKDCLGDYLWADDLVEEIAIGEEVSHSPLNPLSGKHQHIFVRFVKNYHYNEVLDIIDIFYGGEPHSVNLQLCRSLKA
jgi:hypothetical protein